MADTNIRFRLASQFDGEGFQAATQAIQQNQKELQAAKTGLGQISKAFSEISPAANTAVTGIASFADAFTKGGIIGGAITLAMTGIAKAIEYMGEKMEEAKEKVKEWAKVQREDLVSSIDLATAKYEQLQTTSDKAIEKIKDALAAANGQTARDAQNQIYKLEYDKLQSLATTMDEEGKKLIEAQYSQKILVEKYNAELEKLHNNTVYQNQVVEEYAKKTEQAKSKVEEYENILATVKESESKYLTEKQRLENVVTNAKEQMEKENQYSETYRQARERYVEAQIKLTELANTEKGSVEALTTAEKNLEEAKKELQNLTEAQTKQQEKLVEIGEERETVELKYKVELEKAQSQISKLTDKEEDWIAAWDSNTTEVKEETEDLQRRAKELFDKWDRAEKQIEDEIQDYGLTMEQRETNEDLQETLQNLFASWDQEKTNKKIRKMEDITLEEIKQKCGGSASAWANVELNVKGQNDIKRHLREIEHEAKKASKKQDKSLYPFITEFYRIMQSWSGDKMLNVDVSTSKQFLDQFSTEQLNELYERFLNGNARMYSSMQLERIKEMVQAYNEYRYGQQEQAAEKTNLQKLEANTEKTANLLEKIDAKCWDMVTVR